MSETTIPEEEIREAWNNHVCPKIQERQFIEDVYSERDWQIYVVKNHSAIHRRSVAFRAAYLLGSIRHAAKHAEEVKTRDAHCESYALQIERIIRERDEKDAEIERLNKEVEEARGTAHRNASALHFDRQRLAAYQTQLTAAREREEKLIPNQEKKLIDGLSVFSGEDGVWLYFKTSTGQHRALNLSVLFQFGQSNYDPIIIQWAKELALAAYDASRAATKEGA